MKKTNKTPNSTGKNFPWEKLTWDDLSEWTDSRSLERGRSYQRRGAVRNLNLLSDGGLLADVSGTHRYATHVSVVDRSGDLSKRLEAACSCPVGHRCKHGVAVILEFLNAIENGTVVPETDGDDRRLALIENGWENESPEDEFDEADFDDAEGRRDAPFGDRKAASICKRRENGCQQDKENNKATNRSLAVSGPAPRGRPQFAS